MKGRFIEKDTQEGIRLLQEIKDPLALVILIKSLKKLNEVSN